MNKAVLRKFYLEKRSKLTAEELQSKNKKISDQLFKGFDFSKFSVIHTFLPIQKNNEINIWPLLVKIRAINKEAKIIISKSNFDTFEMEHFIYKEETILVENKYGIPEPYQGDLYDHSNFDIVLIPLVAFDLRGHRVGYGKGFYDRFLSKCPPEIIKTGLSLFEPVSNIDDINENDIAMDYCATPDSFYSFKDSEID